MSDRSILRAVLFAQVAFFFLGGILLLACLWWSKVAAPQIGGLLNENNKTWPKIRPCRIQYTPYTTVRKALKDTTNAIQFLCLFRPLPKYCVR